MIRGLDVSYAQGRIPQSDWTQLASDGCKFVFAKVCEGMGAKPDIQCRDHVVAARRAGFATGGYFFVHPLPASKPDEQAKLHYSLMQDCGLGQVGDLLPAVDLEWPPPDEWAKYGCSAVQIRAWSLEYLSSMAMLCRSPSPVYSYPDFWMHLGGGSEPKFAGYPLWIASYTGVGWPTPDARPMVLKPWTSWAYWQWTGSGKLPSGTPVDYDVFGGDDLSAVQFSDRTTDTTGVVATSSEPA